jgi:hypothetical protein
MLSPVCAILEVSAQTVGFTTASMMTRPILFGGRILIRYCPMSVPYEIPQTENVRRRQ